MSIFPSTKSGNSLAPDRGASVALGEVLGGTSEASIDDYGASVAPQATLRGEGMLNRVAGDVVPLALGEHGHAVIAEIDKQIWILAGDPAGAFGLGPAQRAADLDDEVFPLVVAHFLPVTLQEGGLLKLSGGDLIASLGDQLFQTSFRFGQPIDFFFQPGVGGVGACDSASFYGGR